MSEPVRIISPEYDAELLIRKLRADLESRSKCLHGQSDDCLSMLDDMLEQNKVLVSLFRAISEYTGDKGNVDKCLATIRDWKCRVEDFNKVKAKIILGNYDILDALDSDEEIEMLEEQNPELLEAMFALHRYAYGTNPYTKTVNECAE